MPNDDDLYQEEQRQLLIDIKNAIGSNSYKGYIPRGEYKSTKEYNPHDLVYVAGKSYICVKQTVDADPESSDAFVLFADRGPKGEKGDVGDRGELGLTGATGKDGKQGAVGATGARGAKGEKGDKGDRGEKGAKGDKGEKGEKGDDGDSAYEIWLSEGNKGSKQQFLWTLRGPAGSGSGGGGGGAVDSVNGQTGVVVLDTDDVAQGTTNLYSQFETNQYSGLDYIQPTDTTDGLLIGNDLHASVLATFTGGSAIFNGDVGATHGGLNYFLNFGYGISFAGFGGLFVGGHARGTTSAPTQTLANDFLGGVAFTGLDDNTIWATSNANHILAGFIAGTTTNVVGGVLDTKLFMGGVLTPMISVATGTNEIKFNEAQFDADMTFYHDTGIAMFIQGSDGKIGFGTSTINASAQAQILGDLYFEKGAARAIKMEDRSDGAGAGHALTITAGSQTAGTGAGGALNLNGGTGFGVTVGGAVNIVGGGSLTGGSVIIDGGTGVAVGAIQLGVTRGQIRMGAGTVATPKLSFSGTTATGWYEIGANNIGLAIAGTKLVDYSAGLVGITGDLTVTDEAYGVGWDGSVEVPTKNALYDKIQTLGKIYYEAVVATSGGDYTSIEAAIADGKTKIFVRNGTYTLSTALNIVSTVTIIGEDRDNTIIDVTSSGKITVNGNGSYLSNFKITTALATAYILELVGNYITMDNVYLTGSSSSSRLLEVRGSDSNLTNNFLECTGNASTVIFYWSNTSSGTRPRFTNNKVEVNSGNTGPCIDIAHTQYMFTDNSFEMSNGNSGAGTIMNGRAIGGIISNNNFYTGQVLNQKALTVSTSRVIVTDNHFTNFATALTDTATNTVILGNKGLVNGAMGIGTETPNGDFEIAVARAASTTSAIIHNTDSGGSGITELRLDYNSTQRSTVKFDRATLNTYVGAVAGHLVLLANNVTAVTIDKDTRVSTFAADVNVTGAVNATQEVQSGTLTMNALVPTVSETIPTNRVAVTSFKYELTGALTLAIEGTGILAIL